MLYIRGNKLKLILGKGTGPSKMLDYINVNNLGNEIDGAKPINAESLINLNPDVIIFFRKGVESINGIQGIKNINGLSLTNSGKNDRYVIMDDLYLGGFGPRCTKAVLDYLLVCTKVKEYTNLMVKIVFIKKNNYFFIYFIIIKFLFLR